MCYMNFIERKHDAIKFHAEILKATTKNMTGVTLRLSSGMISTDKNNFLHILRLTKKKVAGLHQVFAVVHGRI